MIKIVLVPARGLDTDAVVCNPWAPARPYRARLAFFHMGGSSLHYPPQVGLMQRGPLSLIFGGLLEPLLRHP